MKLFSGLIKIAATVAIVVFSILNTGQMDIYYFFDKPPVKLPVFIVVLSGILLGVLISGLLYSMDRFRLSRRISGLKKHLKKQDDELVRLRNIPFDEPKEDKKL
jgi:uncharacterized integral membrane protein